MVDGVAADVGRMRHARSRLQRDELFDFDFPLSEEPSLPWNVLFMNSARMLSRDKEKTMIRAAVIVVVGALGIGPAIAQSTAPSSVKPETSCTTSGSATSGSGDEKTSNSMAVEKSAILPDAGGANSAAPTVQSGGKPMIVGSGCPPDCKPKG